MEKYRIINISERREMMKKAAEWFHEKWGIPADSYMESMEESLKLDVIVPRWYIVVEKSSIIAGAGVIENDFHERKDLTPNICALFVEEKYRNCGIAGRLLERICNEFYTEGIETMYLITDHTSFYERYGWEFMCMVKEAGKDRMTRMYRHDKH